MRDANKTNAELSDELRELRQRNIELEALLANSKEAEENIRAVSETALDAVIISDQDGNIIFWNKRATEIFGYENKEVRGNPITMLISDEAMGEYNEGKEHVLESGVSLFGNRPKESIAKRKDGTKFPAEFTVSSWKLQDKYYFGGSLRDISEQKLAEKELINTKYFLENVYNTTPDVLLVSDEKGYVTRINKAVEKMLGFSQEELIGKHTSELISKDVKHAHRAGKIMIDLRGKGAIKGFEANLIKKDGGLSPVELNITKLQDSDGKIVGAVAAIRDFTERKQLEESLRKSHDELEKKVKQRTAELKKANEKLRISEEYLKKFAGMLLSAREEERKNISSALHDELGSMALSVTSKITIAKEECNANNKHGTFAALEQAQAAVRKAVEDLRRVAVDLRPPNLEIMGLNAALTDLFDKIKEQVKFKTIFRNELVNKKIPEDTAIVIYRVIQESFTNIIKHAKAKKARINLYSDIRNINIEIADDGIGFDLNKALYRKGNLKIGIKGMRERVESLGGEFTITSAPKQGTQIKATLPKK